MATKGLGSILLPESYLHPGRRDMASSRLTGHHGQAGGREEEAGETCHGTPSCSQGNTAMSTEEMSAAIGVDRSAILGL